MAGQGSRFHRGQQGRWRRLRRTVLDRDNWRCVRCGFPDRLEVHHIKPLWKGGARFDADNCETLCRGCHIAEHAKPSRPDRAAWADRIEELMQ